MEKCHMLILMHSDITDIKGRKGRFGLEFVTLSVAFPVNLANVKNILGNVNHRKTPMSQNVQGMGDSRLSRSYPENPFPIKLDVEILLKGVSCVSCSKKHSSLWMWFNASLIVEGQPGPQAKHSGPQFPLSRKQNRRLGRICTWPQAMFLKFLE